MIEAINGRIRAAVDIHRHFPTEQAAKKLIYLVLADHGPWSARRDAIGSAKKVANWKICLNARVGHFGDRLSL